MSFKYLDVESQYKKDKNLKPEDVSSLLEWAKKQSHLPPISELQALFFLHSCYYRLELAKSALDNFFTVRTLCPEIYLSSLDDPLLKMTMDSVLITPLPQKTPEGYTVFLAKLVDTNPNCYHHASHAKFFDMLINLEMHLNGIVEGYAVIIDSEGASFGHFSKFNFMVAKKQTYYLQEALPIRLKAVHFINVISFLDKIVAMMKPFMKQELIDMLHFHTNSLDTLDDFLPRECLPQDYPGGKAPSVATLHKQINQKVCENFDLIEQLQRLKVDETKRPGKPKKASDIFGVDGTFKKLEFD